MPVFLAGCAAGTPPADDALPCASVSVLVSPRLDDSWQRAACEAYEAWASELPATHFEVGTAEGTASTCTWAIVPGNRDGHLAVTDVGLVMVDETRPLRDDAKVVLLTHEAGHTLGLGDSADATAMMFARINDRHATRITDSDRSLLCSLHRC